MTKWRNSFPVRASRRMHENRGKVCTLCGQSNPLLIVKDGLCANCAGHNAEEKHHPLRKAFRRTKEDAQFVIELSLNAHRIASDLQAGHPPPPVSDPDSEAFREAWSLELMASLFELWLVLTYLNEKPEVSHDLLRVVAILFTLWLLVNITRFDLSHLVERARIKLYENKI
jgi:hypothetical protein